MALQDTQIFKLSTTLKNYLTTDNQYWGLSKIKNQINKDHLLAVLMERAPSNADKVKVIYTTWFLINRPNFKPETIRQIISNLYVITIDWYDDKVYIKQECGNCGGYGYEDCDECDGNGRVDCKTCDGDGNIECNKCYGAGTEECKHCDGKGNETEEDDEGDEIEIECSVCDGSGEEQCRDCGGAGEYTCPDCDGAGNDECGECGGSGEQYCHWCGGSGEVDSDEQYYSITRQKMIVVSSRASEFEDDIIDLNKFNKLESENKAFELNLVYSSSYYDDDVDEDERRETAGMEDNFVEIVDFVKLEDSRL